MDESLRVTLTIAGILDFLEVRWFLGGSLASSVHGIPRATLDADIVADLRLVTVLPLLKALGEDWYAEEGAIRMAIGERSSFNLIHFSSAMKVVFLCQSCAVSKESNLVGRNGYRSLREAASKFRYVRQRTL